MGGGDPWGKSGLPPFFVLFLIFLFLCCFAKNLFTCTNGRRKNRKEHIVTCENDVKLNLQHP